MSTENEINLLERIKINYKLDNMTENLEERIKELTEMNITGKLSRYLEKIFKKEDAEGHFEISVMKDKKGLYEGSFRFHLDGHNYVYKNDVPFKNIEDLMNHAFDHLKREISDS